MQVGEVVNCSVNPADLHLHVYEMTVELFSISPLPLGALLDVGADLQFLALLSNLGGLEVLLLLLLGLFNLFESFENPLVLALVDLPLRHNSQVPDLTFHAELSGVLILLSVLFDRRILMLFR